MIIFIGGVLALFAFLLLMHWFWAKAKPKVSANWVTIVVLILIGSLVLLIASGRLHWLAAAGTAIFPFLRRGFTLFRLAPMLARAWQLMGGGATAWPLGGAFQADAGTQSSTSNESETQTSYLSMRLNHSTGEINGKVLQGPYASRELSDLSETEIVSLYHGIDQESQRLLGAFIQKYFPHLVVDENEDGESSQSSSSDSMTVSKARQVLGVEENASREEIIEAHRRLMQKNHPDRGGSEFIASEINLAKETLLKHL